MLTKNFRICLETMSYSISRTYTAKNIYGNLVNDTCRAQNTFEKTNRVVRVGTGTKTPEEADYCLESPAVGLTLLSTTYFPNVEGDFILYDLNNRESAFSTTSVYRNNTNEDITVREVGLTSCSTSLSGQNTSCCLFCRELIDPVVIHPGETYSFTISLG